MTSADYGAISTSPSDIEESYQYDSFPPPNAESDADALTEEERIKLTSDFILVTVTTLLTPIPFFFIGVSNWRHFPPDPHSVLDTYSIYLGFIWPFASRCIYGFLHYFIYCFQICFGKLDYLIKARAEVFLDSIADILVRYFVARNLHSFHQQYSLGFGWALHSTLFCLIHAFVNFTFWSSNMEPIRESRRALRKKTGKRPSDTPWWFLSIDALLAYPQYIADVVLFAIVPWYLGLAIVLNVAENEFMFRKILLPGLKTNVLLSGFLAFGLFVVALAVAHRL